ncbi:MAG: hypothetical protein HY898_13700 [Deltaproteobacteria bacterium]|nr:hypothetical protein [Deltaproteobacteria bacterium]
MDADAVYWTNFGGNTVMKVPLSGGTPVTLAAGQPRPAGIAVDGNAVYWTNVASGTVMKVDRAGGTQSPLPRI